MADDQTDLSKTTKSQNGVKNLVEEHKISSNDAEVCPSKKVCVEQTNTSKTVDPPSSSTAENDVPIMSVFQKGIVESISLVEYMSTEEREAAMNALKDIVDSSHLWKSEDIPPLPPPPTVRPRGRPKGSKKKKPMTSEPKILPPEVIEVDSKVHDYLTTGTTHTNITSEESRVTEDYTPQAGIRRSSRAVKPTYKVKDSSRLNKIAIKREPVEEVTLSVPSSYSKTTSDSKSTSDEETFYVEENSDFEEDHKVEELEVKDEENKPDEKVVPAKQWKMQKDVKRFLQKSGQLKSKKKTMMSEVKNSSSPNTDLVGEHEAATHNTVCTKVTEVTEPQRDFGTSGDEENKAHVDVHEADRVCMKGFWLIKQEHDVGWMCETCGKVSLYRAAGICHLRTHSKEKPYDCSQCHKKFSFKPNMNRHMSTAHNINASICRVCEAGFGRKQDLLRHSLEKHGLTSAQVNNYCSICDKTFNQRSSYKSHLRYKHSSQKTVFICQFCPKRFNFQSNLIRHAKIHTGDRPHKCTYCDAAFIERKSLTLHQMKSHDTPEVRAMLDVTQKYNCRICNKEFMNKGNLIVHQRVHTKEKPYSCGLCHKNFSIKSNLKRHKATHRGERPYECPDCRKSFTEKRSMEVHRRLHTGEKPFQCDICLRRFSQLSTLNSHKPVHSKERNFKCPYCAATFLRSSHLSTHVRKHTKNSSLQCIQCEASFTNKNDLLQHELKHALVAEQSLTCPICSEKFSASDRLNRHIYSHMGLKLYQCAICGENFDSNKSASEHLSEKHPDEYRYNHTHEDGKEMIVYIEPTQVLSATEEGDKPGEYTTHQIIVTEPTQAAGTLQTSIPLESQLAAEGMVSLAGTASKIITGGGAESAVSNSSSLQVISQAAYDQLMLAQTTQGVAMEMSVAGGVGNEERDGRLEGISPNRWGGRSAGGVGGGMVGAPEVEEERGVGRMVVGVEGGGGGGGGGGATMSEGPIKIEGTAGQVAGVCGGGGQGETVFTVQGQNGEVYVISSQQ